MSKAAPCCEPARPVSNLRVRSAHLTKDSPRPADGRADHRSHGLAIGRGIARALVRTAFASSSRQGRWIIHLTRPCCALNMTPHPWPQRPEGQARLAVGYGLRDKPGCGGAGADVRYLCDFGGRKPGHDDWAGVSRPRQLPQGRNRRPPRVQRGPTRPLGS